MRFQLLLSSLLCLLVTSTIGCAYKKPKFYAVDRPRLDQAQMGNSGYLAGAGNEDETLDRKATRKIYVLEFEKQKKFDLAKASATDDSKQESLVVEQENAVKPSPAVKTVAVPYYEHDQTANETVNAFSDVTQYTVEKDDTLQKISRKVYGTFSKWTKIYDANKDKIKNPNVLRTGQQLIIPRE